MIAYTTVGVNDMERAIPFYDAVFAPLGGGARRDQPDLDRLFTPGRARALLPDPAVRPRRSDPSATGTMLAFLAEDRAAVDAFHAAALGEGGVCEGPPGVREGMNPVFYAAYVRDRDGNKLCAFVRK